VAALRDFVRWHDGDNPVRTVKPVKESEGRIRYLEGDEERQFLAAAAEPLRTMILVGLYAASWSRLRPSPYVGRTSISDAAS
jgi:hypothetical protein